MIKQLTDYGTQQQHIYLSSLDGKMHCIYSEFGFPYALSWEEGNQLKISRLLSFSNRRPLGMMPWSSLLAKKIRNCATSVGFGFSARDASICGKSTDSIKTIGTGNDQYDYRAGLRLYRNANNFRLPESSSDDVIEFCLAAHNRRQMNVPDYRTSSQNRSMIPPQTLLDKLALIALLEKHPLNLGGHVRIKDTTLCSRACQAIQVRRERTLKISFRPVTSFSAITSLK